MDISSVHPMFSHRTGENLSKKVNRVELIRYLNKTAEVVPTQTKHACAGSQPTKVGSVCTGTA